MQKRQINLINPTSINVFGGGPHTAKPGVVQHLQQPCSGLLELLSCEGAARPPLLLRLALDWAAERGKHSEQKEDQVMQDFESCCVSQGKSF